MKNMSPFGRVAQVNDVARAVFFLASADSSFIAGNELFVDGGIMAD
ncbi:SDR family oxidoreductase [Klebsiella aerogenes]